ncbi:MAG: adenylate/guanylate cyclase domain-containing protein [Candidatus Wallbacteria bacterium]
MSDMKSQNLSIMMTDIQGYTNASSVSSREQIVGLIRRHNQLMMPVIQFYGGKIIKSIGDAFLCTFQSATDAVVCAIIIQLILKEYNQRQLDEAKKMNLRVVINTGDVTLEKNDIFGDAVNITARMEGLPCFPGGTIGISESTYLLMNKNEIISEKIGPQTLKGIPEPVTVYQVPLENQKLNQIPAKLLQLVEKVMESKTSNNAISSMQLNEWVNTVGTFLKEKNWGDNIHNIQQHLKQTFTQKTVLEKKSAVEFNDASIMRRIKSSGIDFVILIVIIFVFNICFAILSSHFRPALTITSDEYYRLPSAESKIYKLSKNDYKTYERQIPLIEALGIKVLSYGGGILIMWIYFGGAWFLKGATPGQIAVKTAVVDCKGSKPNFMLSFKRSALFIASFALLGLGMLMIFTGEKKTFYDLKCDTRVIE